MVCKSLRDVARWLLGIALAVSLIWPNDDKLVGKGGILLQLLLVGGAVAYGAFARFQASWERLEVGEKDGRRAVGAFALFAITQAVVLAMTTEQERLADPRRYASLFTVIALACLLALTDGAFARSRHQRARVERLRRGLADESLEKAVDAIEASGG